MLGKVHVGSTMSLHTHWQHAKLHLVSTSGTSPGCFPSISHKYLKQIEYWMPGPRTLWPATCFRHSASTGVLRTPSSEFTCLASSFSPSVTAQAGSRRCIHTSRVERAAKPSFSLRDFPPERIRNFAIIAHVGLLSLCEKAIPVLNTMNRSIMGNLR